jgi:hypothetical protein
MEGNRVRLPLTCASASYDTTEPEGHARAAPGAVSRSDRLNSQCRKAQRPPRWLKAPGSHQALAWHASRPSRRQQGRTEGRNPTRRQIPRTSFESGGREVRRLHFIQTYQIDMKTHNSSTTLIATVRNPPPAILSVICSPAKSLNCWLNVSWRRPRGRASGLPSE